MALSDYAQTMPNQPFDVDVLVNDRFCSIPPDTNSLEIVVPPISGTAEVSSSGYLVYTPEPDFVGSDSLVYRICFSENPPRCMSAQVVITVGTDTVTSDSCRGQLLDDDAYFSPGDTARVDVLINDQLCFSRDSAVVTTFPSPGVESWVGDNQNVYLLWSEDTITVAQVPYQVCGPTGDCWEAYIELRQPSLDTVDLCYLARDDELYLDSTTVFPVALPILFNDSLCDVAPVVELEELIGGMVTLKNGSFMFTPTDENAVSITFIYQLCNSDLSQCTKAEVIVYLKDSLGTGGEDPECNIRLEDDYFVSDSIQQNTVRWELPVLANDVLGEDTLATLSVVDVPRQGSTTIVDQQVVYSLSDSTYLGQDSFVYRVCSSNGSSCKEATVVVEFKKGN